MNYEENTLIRCGIAANAAEDRVDIFGDLVYAAFALESSRLKAKYLA